MKTLNFMKTLFLLVAIVGLSSCGDKYYSDDYLRNSNAKLCGKTWVNDSEKNDVDEWVRHTLKFDDNGVTYFDNVWVREHNMSGKLNGKVVVFVDSKYNRN